MEIIKIITLAIFLVHSAYSDEAGTQFVDFLSKEIDATNTFQQNYNPSTLAQCLTTYLGSTLSNINNFLGTMKVDASAQRVITSTTLQQYLLNQVALINSYLPQITQVLGERAIMDYYTASKNNFATYGSQLPQSTGEADQASLLGPLIGRPHAGGENNAFAKFYSAEKTNLDTLVASYNPLIYIIQNKGAFSTYMSGFQQALTDLKNGITVNY